MLHKLSVAGILLATLISAGGAWAAPVSPEQAIAIAAGFRNAAPVGHKAPAAGQLRIAMTGKTPGGENAYYAVNYGNSAGFAIVSADDCAPKILGYSESGSFDADNVPSNLKWWFGEYARQISWAAEHNLDASSDPADTRPDIEQLMKTTWDQSTPYNNLCPKYHGERSVTGCVATAMAQVMNYHRWPPRSQGECEYNGRIVTLNNELNWADMLDSYRGEYTEAEANAVARLMFDCGRSVDMSYSPTESGAYTDNVPSAFYRNFDYDLSISYLIREYYSDDEWTSLMYNELAAGRPIIYGGNSDAGGHQFVADGYRTGGYFHINWGWSGDYDGYFLLDALTPEGMGIGGGVGGFNYDQDAVCRIMKPCGGSLQILVTATGDFVNSKASEKDNFGIIGSSWEGPQGPINGFVNFTGSDFTVTPGVRVTSISNPANVRYFEMDESTDFYYWSTILARISVKITGLSDGEYRVSPMFKDEDGIWHATRFKPDAQNCLRLIVEDGQKTYRSPSWGNIKITSIELKPLESEISLGETLTVDAVISPADASFKELEWLSENPLVAKVDHDGKVTPVGVGEATITASALDGSGVVASCIVKVKEGTGVETTVVEVGEAPLYNAQGIMIRKSVNRSELRDLPSGLYIFGHEKIFIP